MPEDLEIEISLTNNRPSAANLRKQTHASPDHRPPTADNRLVVEDAPDDRYSRLKLIPWWDQELLRKARVMVVGAGAIGNELLKNLALLGVGRLFIVDMDKIENSNLSRSVLYRAKDEGRFKAQVAAERCSDLNPDVKAQPLIGNISYDVGLGVFRAMDVVLGGLDNREARLNINMSCWKVSRPFIDGAIEVLHGIARVFTPPDSACYECTMNEMDFQLLNQRRSCALLSREELLTGKVPTTPTTSSVIAGIQTQEAVKLLHQREDLPTLAGKGFFFNGLTHDSYVVEYPRKEFCLSHETYEHITETPLSAQTTTLRQALQLAKDALGPDAVLEFGREMVKSLNCGHCQTEETVFQQLGKVSHTRGLCPSCGQMRVPELTHSVAGGEPFLDLTLSRAGVPDFDIITARLGMETRHFELTGDRDKTLGIVK